MHAYTPGENSAVFCIIFAGYGEICICMSWTLGSLHDALDLAAAGCLQIFEYDFRLPRKPCCQLI
jgi:hypothetical protein